MLENQEKLFLGKKVMYFIPHEDDEINMGGGLIYWIAKYAAVVKVVYAMNGDYRASASKRMYEAIASLQTLGIKKQDVIFLGYPDRAIEGYSGENTIISRNGSTNTYIPDDIKKEYPDREFISKAISRENLNADIFDQIKEFQPDILFCVDFDSHLDHRILSLCFEAAVGRIVKEVKDYHPVVYKQFAYTTNYKGPKDFYGRIMPETRFAKEDNSDTKLQNPYYEWNRRVRFALPIELRTRNLRKNIVFSALKQHRSQSIISRADRIINNDSVAWQRRTDSLLLNEACSIEASSGKAECLNDFQLFDCQSFAGGGGKEPLIDAGAWIPDKDDSSPKINIHFSEGRGINQIVLYRAHHTTDFIKKICIQFDKNQSFIYEKNDSGYVWTINLGINSLVFDITISVIEEEGNDGGFSEIEIFEPVEPSVDVKYQLCKGNVAYEENTPDIDGMYQYDGFSASSVGNEIIAGKDSGLFLNFNNLFNYFFLKFLRAKYSLIRKMRKLLHRY